MGCVVWASVSTSIAKSAILRDIGNFRQRLRVPTAAMKPS